MTSSIRSCRSFRPLASVALLALGACKGFTADGGLGPASTFATAEFGKEIAKATTQAEAQTAQAKVEQLHRRPLTAETTVQIALLKNRNLQASFNDLGVSEAEYVRATLPPVPSISVGRTTGNLTVELAQSAAASLIELATLPARQALASRRFEAAQVRTAYAVAKLAAESQRQFYRTVAANQSVAFLEQALSTAESASALATGLGETGALNKLEQAREHAFYTELGAQLARARVQQRVERERLTRQLGLWGRDIDFKLPLTLPALPGRLVPGIALETQALTRRADLRAARLDLDAVAIRYGLTMATGFVNAVDVGYSQSLERTKSVRVGEGGGIEIDRERSMRRGVSVDLSIPIYDFGRSSVIGAREAYLGTANRLAARAVEARSQVREAYQRYRGNHDLARHYRNSVLPLRQTIQDQALLQYNGMLVDVTQLIIDARARILSNIQAIEAQRDFWIASTDLKAAIVGGVADAEASEPPALASLASAAPD